MEEVPSHPDEVGDRALSVRTCWERLRSEAYGRLAVLDEDGPVIYPINAVVDHGTIVFRTAAGAKLDAIHADARVSFEVDGYDAETTTAWSVVIRGTAREIVRSQDAVEATELGVTPWQDGQKPTYVRIEPTLVAGREFIRTGFADAAIGPSGPGQPSSTPSSMDP